MPFQSEAQRAYLYKKDPAVAAKFEAETPPGANLPDRVAPKMEPNADEKLAAMKTLTKKAN